MQYAEIAVAAAGTVALAWAADFFTGRRGLGGALLIASVAAACGAFLAIRVFAVAALSDWSWVAWSMSAAVLCLVAFFLLRSKR